MALLKGVKIPRGTQPWADFVSHIMVEIDPTGLPLFRDTKTHDKYKLLQKGQYLKLLLKYNDR